MQPRPTPRAGPGPRRRRSPAQAAARRHSRWLVARLRGAFAALGALPARLREHGGLRAAVAEVRRRAAERASAAADDSVAADAHRDASAERSSRAPDARRDPAADRPGRASAAPDERSAERPDRASAAPDGLGRTLAGLGNGLGRGATGLGRGLAHGRRGLAHGGRLAARGGRHLAVLARAGAHRLGLALRFLAAHLRRHGLAAGRFLWSHRSGIAGVALRVLWWGALALLLVGGRALTAVQAPLLVAALPYFGAGLALCLPLLFARAARLRWAGFALGLGHAALAAIAWTAGSAA